MCLARLGALRALMHSNFSHVSVIALDLPTLQTEPQQHCFAVEIDRGDICEPA